MILLLLLCYDSVLNAAQPSVIVSNALKRRLERVQQLSDVPTARMILRLLERDPEHREPQVVKRLRKAVDAWQQQARSLTDHLLLQTTTIGEDTSVSLVNLVLYLAQDDPALFLHYMTRRELARLRQAVTRYHALYWPENARALEDCLQLLRAAKSLRDLIAHLDKAAGASDVVVVDAELVRVALRRMKLLCRQRIQQTHKIGGGATAEGATIFGEEVDDFLGTLTALLVDREEQQQQFAIVMALWQNLCPVAGDGPIY